MEVITSITNAKVKFAASLLQRKKRDKEGLFILEGLRNVELVINCNKLNEVYACFITEDMLGKERVENLLAQLDEKKVFIVNQEILAKITEAVTPQGIVLIVKQNNYNWHDLSQGIGPLLILDRIMDPGNMGTIIRTADAMGARGIIALKGSTDIYAPKVIRSVMGSIFSVPFISGVTVEDLVAYCQAEELSVVLADLDDKAKPLYDLDLKNKVAIILGNEANGVAENLKASFENKFYIPMQGSAESLNVAMATSMIMYEYTRQVLSVDGLSS